MCKWEDLIDMKTYNQTVHIQQLSVYSQSMIVCPLEIS